MALWDQVPARALPCAVLPNQTDLCNISQLQINMVQPVNPDNTNMAAVVIGFFAEILRSQQRHYSQSTLCRPASIGKLMQSEETHISLRGSHHLIYWKADAASQITNVRLLYRAEALLRVILQVSLKKKKTLLNFESHVSFVVFFSGSVIVDPAVEIISSRSHLLRDQSD